MRIFQRTDGPDTKPAQALAGWIGYRHAISKACRKAEVQSGLSRAASHIVAQDDPGNGFEIIVPVSPETILAVILGRGDNYQLFSGRSRDRAQLGQRKEPGFSDRGTVEQDAQDIALGVFREGVQLDVELDGFGLGDVYLGAAFHLQLDDGAGLLVDQKQIYPVIVGNGLVGG